MKLIIAKLWSIVFLLLIGSVTCADEDRDWRDFQLPRSTFQPQTKFFIGKFQRDGELKPIFLRLSSSEGAKAESLIGSYFLFSSEPCQITPTLLTGTFAGGALQLSETKFDREDGRVSLKPTMNLTNITSWEQLSSAATLTGDWGFGSKKTRIEFSPVESSLPEGFSSTTRRVQKDLKPTGDYVDVNYPVLQPSAEPGASIFNSGMNRWLSPQWDTEYMNDEPERKSAHYNTAACDFSFASPRLVSAVLQVENYMGGNKSPNSTQTRTFDFHDQKFLNLSDIFLPTANPLRSLSILTTKALGGPYTEGVRNATAAKTDNFQNWAFSPAGILVFFDYVAGENNAENTSPTVLIPYGQIRHILRPDYRFG